MSLITCYAEVVFCCVVHGAVPTVTGLGKQGVSNRCVFVHREACTRRTFSQEPQLTQECNVDPCESNYFFHSIFDVGFILLTVSMVMVFIYRFY